VYYTSTDGGETFEAHDGPHRMRFDSAHYRKVRAARNDESQARPDYRMVDHPLLGRRVKMGNTVGVIEGVYKHFYLGYYEYAVYRIEDTKSHGTAIVKNISSRCPIIDAAAQEFTHATLL